VLERWRAAHPSVAGVAVDARAGSHRSGDTRLTVTPEAGAPPIVQQVGTFTQVNVDANRLLVQAVLRLVPADTAVLDLFCGSGNVSMPIARMARALTGIDTDAAAIADAAASATAAGIANARFEVGAADRWLRRRGLAGADVVVLDPPRTGAREVTQELARLRPPRVVYVSCEPTTLARDVRALTAAGYVVDRVQPIDMFPHTEHVETVLEAVLTAS
jgi:23S rRNA (uracil1939-C5)-methyltransferase